MVMIATEEVTIKIALGIDVLDAAQSRIAWLFNSFPRLCLSFSGGKDSTVMFHLVAAHARKIKRHFSVLFIDWEAQYSHTITHVESMRAEYQDIVDKFYWVALPLTTQNAVSQYQPEWVCWQSGITWLRNPPLNAITNPLYFPFYRIAMTFEAFIPEFAQWFAQQQPAAILVGIRSDESFQRFGTIASRRKRRYAKDKPWTTCSPQGYVCNAYPIYDWKTEDIWTWFARTQERYNPLYDLMHQAGVSLRNMRICEPFGPEQRKGLWLYHVLEPERWAALCHRVSGANSGRLYAHRTGDFYAHRHLVKPAEHSWHSYALFLLETMPASTAEHFKNKIAIYLRWYQQHGYPADIPDEQEKDLGSKDIPSWRRICKVLLRNDYWCRQLSFSPNKPSNYKRYSQRIRSKRQSWGLL
jgi:Predicted phosphoadenosine phosphosulfate sulfotransferase